MVRLYFKFITADAEEYSQLTSTKIRAAFSIPCILIDRIFDTTLIVHFMKFRFIHATAPGGNNNNQTHKLNCIHYGVQYTDQKSMSLKVFSRQ